MSMHAEAIVDLVEIEHQEVQFRQVQGDFSMLQGKFMLQEGTLEVTGQPLVHAFTHGLYLIQCSLLLHTITRSHVPYYVSIAALMMAKYLDAMLTQAILCTPSSFCFVVFCMAFGHHTTDA